MNIDLSGKTALVTGAGTGIGESCARCLSECGAFVWVNDLEADRAHQVAKDIKGQALIGDVAQDGPWLQPVLDHGQLHVLVHNAGYDLPSPISDLDPAEFNRLIAVQVTGPTQITRQLLPALKAAQGAAIIHIASVHALVTEPAMSAYAACKGALVSMVRGMAQDLGPDQIRVLAVSPGYIQTALLEQWIESRPAPETTRAASHALHPLGRMGTPQDIGNLVAFLASPLAEFMTGTNVVIDGALSACLYQGPVL
jgi:meso-butanediol dehydrogenase/(S,S)-butanediol dehydrogenase/diacetyl reductase